MIYEITDTQKFSPLFGEWHETFICCCLQGIMGKLYANDHSAPTAAMAVIGDFTFFAGKADEELIAFTPDWCMHKFRIMVPRDNLWKAMILQHYKKRAKLISRYATRKEPDLFDREKLKDVVFSLPQQYQLSMIDERLYQMCRSETWSADLVSGFPDYESYLKWGIGAVICKDQRIVSGASSYCRYQEGIEIEIDTREEYRRQGLAYVCAAKLILECLKKNLYPGWDAHNKASLSLAEKLGYRYSHTYETIEIWDD